VGNIDVTVIAQAPKLKDYIPQMQANLAGILGVETDRVNVKATTEERLGFTGDGSGIACHSVCILEQI
jgi:2-C-methyl-D-erythritol 2,4-cyclodiphosphate synthase